MKTEDNEALTKLCAHIRGLHSLTYMRSTGMRLGAYICVKVCVWLCAHVDKRVSVGEDRTNLCGER